LIAAAFFLITVIFIIVCVASHSPNPVFLSKNSDFYNQKKFLAEKHALEIKLEGDGILKSRSDDFSIFQDNERSLIGMSKDALFNYQKQDRTTIANSD